MENPTQEKGREFQGQQQGEIPGIIAVQKAETAIRGEHGSPGRMSIRDKNGIGRVLKENFILRLLGCAKKNHQQLLKTNFREKNKKGNNIICALA